MRYLSFILVFAVNFFFSQEETDLRQSIYKVLIEKSIKDSDCETTIVCVNDFYHDIYTKDYGAIIRFPDSILFNQSFRKNLNDLFKNSEVDSLYFKDLSNFYHVKQEVYNYKFAMNGVPYRFHYIEAPVDDDVFFNLIFLETRKRFKLFVPVQIFTYDGLNLFTETRMFRIKVNNGRISIKQCD